MNPNQGGIQMGACTALEKLALGPDTQNAIGEVGGSLQLLLPWKDMRTMLRSTKLLV
jgi:hypothetical protein